MREIDTILTVEGICKNFGTVRALHDVSFSVNGGDIRGFIGENGSGKTTLAAIVAGALKRDGGSMTFAGEEYDPHNVLDAQARGAGMVVQEMGTVSGITVSENIFMGKERVFTKFGVVNTRAMRAEAKALLESLGLPHIEPSMYVDAYTAEDRKLIEIARALYSKPRLLIIDETTTALSHKGRAILYDLMKKMAAEGKAVLFISHDLDEITSVCTALTVLRDGAHIADLERPEFEAEKIKHLMVGRKIEGDYYRADFDGSSDSESVLVMEDVSDERLRDFSLALHKGEILGICGLSESGIRNVGRLAFGIEKPISGRVHLPGKDAAVENPKASIKYRLGYASKDRDTESLVLDDSVRNNLVVPVYDELRSHGLILGSAEKAYAQKQVDFLSIKCSSMEQLVQTLSGGNKQKVVFGRWMGAGSDILILDCPTRGVDIGVKTVMYQLIHQLKKQGKSILMISEELPELIGMCDRILVVKNGRLSKEFARSRELAERDIIEHMI